MPSLADILKQRQPVLTRDASGQLVEQSQEEIQNLSQKAGLAAPPLTPLGAQAIGANEDQQKMMGTPAQKQAALTIAQQPQQDLQTVLRRQQARTQMTAEEQAASGKSENLKNLGSLGDRVHDFLEGQRAKLATAQQAQLQAQEQVTGASGQKVDTSGELKDTLAALSSDPNNMQLQLKANQLLGYTTQKQLSPADIANLYKDVTASVAQSGAQAVQDKLTMHDLIEQGGLGYDAAQLSNLLGVPEDQIAGMSVGQVQDQVHKLLSEEFGKSQQALQQAGSTQMGAAERGMAQQVGRELSATGVRASEAAVQQLEQKIAQGQQVQFAGQMMPIEQALSDDNISKTITDYLQAAPGSPTRTQLEQSEPQLVQFIQQNQAALQGATEKIGAGATQFQQLQSANKQALTLDGQIPDDLAEKLGLPIGQLSAEQINPNDIPVLAAAQGLDSKQKTQYTTDLSLLTSKVPDAAEEMKGLSVQEIQALGLDQPHGLWEQYSNHKQEMAAQADALQKHAGDPEALYADLFGDTPGGYKAAQHEFENQYKSSLLGLPNEWDKLSQLDPDGDGRMQSPEYYARERMQDLQRGYSLKDAVSGKSGPNTAALHAPEETPLDEGQQLLWQKLAGPVSDGHLTSRELIDTNLSYDDLMGLSDRAPGLDPGSLEEALAQKAMAEVKNHWNLRDERGLESAINDLTSRRDAAADRMTTSGHKSAVKEQFQSDLNWLQNKLAEVRGEPTPAQKSADSRTRANSDKTEAAMKKNNTNQMIGKKLPANWDRMSSAEQRDYMKKTGAIK